LEKQQGKILLRHAVRAAFETTLVPNPAFDLAPDINGSYFMLRMFISKALVEESIHEWRQTREADMMFGTSISNLLNPESIERLATVQSDR
jgi:hypothetical protein